MNVIKSERKTKQNTGLDYCCLNVFIFNYHFMCKNFISFISVDKPLKKLLMHVSHTLTFKHDIPR